jgi:phosphatidylglycerophosphate synthase
MKLERIKKVFNRFIEPFLNMLVRLKITPNEVTTSVLFFLTFAVYFIVKKNMFYSALFVFLTSIIDAVDGALAKKVGSTKFGDFYDALLDRIVEAVLFLAISYTYPAFHFLAFIAFAFSFLTSYVAARAEVWTIGIKIKYLGVGGRSGRLTVLILSLLFNRLEWGLYLIIFMALITMISRTFVTMKTLRNR